MTDDRDIIDKARKGTDYSSYMNMMAELAGQDPHTASEEDAEKIGYTGLNLHRAQRIARTWRPTPQLTAAVTSLPGPQVWLALTEPWCGDSAQCLPPFAVLADSRPDIDLHILQRDKCPEVMDKFLTDGKRSIPIVIGLNLEGEELFRWGPRPREAQAVFEQAKADGLEKPDILERLHLFYGRNRNQALAAELTELFSGVGS